MADPENVQQTGGNTWAIFGLVFGILAVITSVAGPFGLPCALLGLIFAAVALTKMKTQGRAAMSWVGLGLSILGLCISALVTVTVWSDVISGEEERTVPQPESDGESTSPTEWFKENVPSDYDPITNNDVDDEIAGQMYQSLSDDQLATLCSADGSLSDEYDQALDKALSANGWLPLGPLFDAAGVDKAQADVSFVKLDLNVLVEQECNRRS